MPNDFSEQSNAENALRYGRIAELLAKNDILPIVSAVAWNPEIVAAFKKEFPHSLVVYLHCPLEICVARDPQGLYRRTGDEVQRIYREPREYDLTVDTGVMPLARCAQVILTRIIEMVPFTMRNIS